MLDEQDRLVSNY